MRTNRRLRASSWLAWSLCFALSSLGCGDADAEQPARDKSPSSTDDATPWTGTAVDKGTELDLRFDLREKDGELRGTFWIEDPETRQLQKAGLLSGRRSAEKVEWRTDSDVAFEGTIQGEKLAGDLTFPRQGSEPALTIPLALGAEP